MKCLIVPTVCGRGEWVLSGVGRYSDGHAVHNKPDCSQSAQDTGHGTQDTGHRTQDTGQEALTCSQSVPQDTGHRTRSTDVQLVSPQDTGHRKKSTDVQLVSPTGHRTQGYK